MFWLTSSFGLSFASNVKLWTILGHCTRRSKIKIRKNIEYGRCIKSDNYSLKILKTAMITVLDLGNYITGTIFLIYGFTGIKHWISSPISIVKCHLKEVLVSLLYLNSESAKKLVQGPMILHLRSWTCWGGIVWTWAQEYATLHSQADLG